MKNTQKNEITKRKKEKKRFLFPFFFLCCLSLSFAKWNKLNLIMNSAFWKELRRLSFMASLILSFFLLFPLLFSFLPVLLVRSLFSCCFTFSFFLFFCFAFSFSFSSCFSVSYLFLFFLSLLLSFLSRFTLLSSFLSCFYFSFLPFLFSYFLRQGKEDK